MYYNAYQNSNTITHRDERTILIFIWKNKQTNKKTANSIGKTILNNKRTPEVSPPLFSSCKSYSKKKS